MADLKNLILIAFFVLSCSKEPSNCLELKYVNGITYYYEAPYTGKCNQFFTDGNIKSSQQFINGLDHGNWKFYFANGKIETEASFINGKRNGRWNYYYENGSVKQINFYKKGIKDSIWTKFYENGKIMWIKKFENGNIVESEEFNYLY